MRGRFFFPQATPVASQSEGDTSAVHINREPLITIEGNDDPEIILSTAIELAQPSRLKISGVIMGTFYHVCGIAAYVNDAAINQGTGNNRNHPDCFEVLYGLGGDSRLLPVPYITATEDVLVPGTHTIKIGVVSRWYAARNPIYINNRNSADMAGSSSLIVEAI